MRSVETEQHEHRGDRLHRARLIGADAHFPHADCRQRRGHQRRTVDDQRLLIAIDQCFQRVARRRRGGADGDCARNRRPARASASTAMQSDPDPWSGRFASCPPMCASGCDGSRLRPDHAARSVCARTEIMSSDCATKCTACSPSSASRRGFRAKNNARPFASQSAVTNRLANAGCISSARASVSDTSNIEISSTRKRLRRLAPQFDPAQFDVVLRADPYRAVRAQVGPSRIEMHPVAVERGAIRGGVVRRGMLGDRDRRRRPCAAGRRTSRMRRAVRRHASARRPRGRSGSIRRRCRAAPRCSGRWTAGVSVAAPRPVPLRPATGIRWRLSACACPGGGSSRREDLARNALLQQRRDRADPRFAHSPSRTRTVVQRVAQRNDRHALMVGHERIDDRMGAVAGLPLGSEVERFDETHFAARTHAFQSLCRFAVAACGLNIAASAVA